MDPVATALTKPPAVLAAGTSLFLDFDGTLVEIAESPDAVAVDARLRALMICLAEAFEGRMAIVTGRASADIRALFDGIPIAIAGSHGVELCWSDGRIETPERMAVLDHALDRMVALRLRFPGLLIEDKPFGVALHYRQAPEAEPEARAVAEELAQSCGLALQPGKMVFELRAPGAGKGGALRTLLADASMAGTTPIFLGDDVTDESAFAAARELGGFGILIGPPRPTAALYGLPGVSHALDWLEDACGRMA
ncbi:trehalose-phosphatase [Flavisphingomonas formosensis]|uniref:trehalose-phosphatase n=1 Tax=Flavisphingomonas formosensis TaxID=861534 RepID=UPI0012FA7649|nr:trehalose-phosphatase [Sphingomonas formosensis]